jgi:hypothetical protein
LLLALESETISVTTVVKIEALWGFPLYTESRQFPRGIVKVGAGQCRHPCPAHQTTQIPFPLTHPGVTWRYFLRNGQSFACQVGAQQDVLSIKANERQDQPLDKHRSFVHEIKHIIPGFPSVVLLLFGVQEPEKNQGTHPVNPVRLENLRRLSRAYW